jgi:methionyl aminopeptidase
MSKTNIKLKTKEDIDKMRSGGKILARVMSEVTKAVKPGVNAKELHNLTVKLIKASGGKPSFEGYTTSWAPVAFPSAVCVSVNEEVVHGMAVTQKIIKSGDIVGLDIGMEYDGRFTDMAKSVIAGSVDKEAKKLVRVAEDALMAGIKQIKPGNHVSDVSRAIEDVVKKSGFSVVKQLVGHGVGFGVHEPPQIPNYVDHDVDDIELKEGMCLALEPMVNVGGWEVENLEDGWTVVTKDGSLSAHFEHTVVVTGDGYEILTI